MQSLRRHRLPVAWVLLGLKICFLQAPTGLTEMSDLELGAAYLLEIQSSTI